MSPKFDGEKTTPSVYIFGSGASLLDLTSEEVAFLNAQPRTLSLNRYLLHWETVGVVPKAHLLADAHFPCIKFFVETQAVIQAIGTPITHYINPAYLRFFPDNCSFRAWKHAIRKRWEIWRKFSYFVPFTTMKGNLIPFERTNADRVGTRYSECLDEEGWFWAKSLDEPMLFFRGTLTSAINLAAVVWPNANIKLLGVDLNSYGYFFDPKTEPETEEERLDRIRRTDEVRAAHHSKSRDMGAHATAVSIKLNDTASLPPIQSIFPKIVAQLESEGRALSCCNPNSLLVQDGICPYSPVID